MEVSKMDYKKPKNVSFDNIFNFHLLEEDQDEDVQIPQDTTVIQETPPGTPTSSNTNRIRESNGNRALGRKLLDKTINLDLEDSQLSEGDTDDDDRPIQKLINGGASIVPKKVAFRPPSKFIAPSATSQVHKLKQQHRPISQLVNSLSASKTQSKSVLETQPTSGAETQAQVSKGSKKSVPVTVTRNDSDESDFPPSVTISQTQSTQSLSEFVSKVLEDINTETTQNIDAINQRGQNQPRQISGQDQRQTPASHCGNCQEMKVIIERLEERFIKLTSVTEKLSQVNGSPPSEGMPRCALNQNQRTNNVDVNATIILSEEPQEPFQSCSSSSSYNSNSNSNPTALSASAKPRPTIVQVSPSVLKFPQQNLQRPGGQSRSTTTGASTSKNLVDGNATIIISSESDSSDNELPDCSPPQAKKLKPNEISRPFEYNTCHNTYVTKGSLIRHNLKPCEINAEPQKTNEPTKKRRNYGPLVECKVCSTTYTARGNYLRHTKTMLHKNNEMKQAKAAKIAVVKICYTCGEQFDSSESLKKHCLEKHITTIN